MFQKKIKEKQAKIIKLSTQRIIASFLLLPLISISAYLYSQYAHAAITKEISYQGKLTNTSGVAVADGNYNMVISLYTASTGGTPVWTARGTVGTPTTRSVSVTNGIFSIMLGDTTAGDNAINLDFNSTYYLGIKVGSDTEMTPRKKVGASGYAFNSDLLDGLNSATSGADAHIVATDASGSLFVDGNVGIGTTSPVSKLQVTSSIVDSNGASSIYHNPTVTQTVAGYSNYGYRLVMDNDLSWGSNTTYGIHVTNNGSPAGTMHGIYAYAPGYAIYGKGGTYGVYGDNSVYSNGVGVYGRTMGTSAGSALKAESTSITSSSLVSFVHSNSSFSGNGLLMNFANSSGTFSGNFIDLQKNGVSQLFINANGQVTGGSYNGITLDDASDGFVLSGGTTSRTLTIAGSDVSINQNLRTTDTPSFAGLIMNGMTQGSVTFIGADGLLSQDNSNLFWDNTNKRLGIGTNSPAYGLQVNSTGYFAGLTGPGAEHRFKSQTTGVIMPMYIYPTDIYTNTDYNRVIDLKKKYHDVPLYVILNPNSGPGSVTDGNYAAAIQRFRGAGVVVLGYVATSYGAKSLANVATEVSTWKSLYPDVDGIFFDEMSNDMGDISYYVSAKQDVHSKGLHPVIGNPGTALDGSFFTAQSADFYITYESSSYPSEATLEGDWDGGNADFPYRDRGAIVYNASWDADTIRMMRKYAGLIYVTNDDASNPWDSVSSHLEDLFSVLSSRDDTMFVDATTGYVGIGTTDPLSKLHVLETSNNPSTSIAMRVKNYPIITTDGTYNSYGSILQTDTVISSGITNSGALSASNFYAFRNASGTGDSGTLNGLLASGIAYGHSFLDPSATPQTNKAYGLQIYPYAMTGTISTAYDLYIGPTQGTETNITDHYGIYQASNSVKNYFAGNVGIGTTSPGVKLDVNGGAIRTNNQLISTIATGTAPLSVTSTTVNTNLNADLWDGNQFASYLNQALLTTSSPTFGGLTVNGNIEYTGSLNVNKDSVKYYRNLAHYSTGSASVTGTMKITMPKSWSNTMMQIRIQGYNYSSNRGAWEVIISGYNSTGSPAWVNNSVEIKGRPPFNQVRLAHDGTNNVLLLGTTSTTWNYPKITISEFIAGHSNITGWESGWTIAPITDETGIAYVETPTPNTYFAGSSSYYVNTSGQLTLNTDETINGIDINAGAISDVTTLYTTGAVRFANFGAGTLTTDASGNVSVSSDERLKNISGKFERGLDELMSINPISYYWKSSSGLDTENEYTGFSAQNVNEFIPEAVGLDKRGFLTLSDRPILATAVNAIKEQQTNINDLNLKTNTNIDNIEELQESINQQLGIVEATFVSIGKKVESNSMLLEEQQTKIATLENKSIEYANIAVELQQQMDLIKQQNQTILDFALALDVKKLIYKDESGNLDLKTGKLITAEVVAGAFTVKVTDEDNKTIGEAKIKAITKDENNDGIDDETGSDGKSVVVKTAAVGEGSKIFVTTNTAIEFPLAVTKKIEGEGFVVEVKNVVSENIIFDWWIVESEK